MRLEDLDPLDLNIDYPIEEFMADMQGSHERSKSNIIRLPRPIKMKTREGVEEIRVNPNHPLVKAHDWFIDKYGSDVLNRLIKVTVVTGFLIKWESELKEKGLINENGEIWQPFLSYLLSVPINIRSKKIPKAAIAGYIREEKEYLKVLKERGRDTSYWKRRKFKNS